MSSKAAPEAELRPAFAALDVNGGGGMLRAMECVGRNLPAGGSRDEESLARKAAVAFDALDVDKSGTLDYEEFVAVLSGLRHTDPLEALSE
ncbi:hypothetical protein EMIHUDRAFT_257817 [Emiliania huxleyi CCMP1516]|uniref:EF-hand domain-containing protein n=2 Tax=Emiliania huxleyi TaxID=2903 RepID=A0A0D3IFV1_EMIH1|nr:hypothetical protein EMIHUDRAFT_257817 [Emiliania huxleyi CCMP1516]EOD10136.1 hypothetical protein EMIHUDRAFT_257817 [Emiliania huxleyi CCMP1516]|eukprot:XP_005762565.1 hypothetical protein EMIHUDRAFT_257817 [Emiliania huxleyi CCMP1516]